MPSYEFLTKNFLYKHYVQLNKSSRQIAKETGCSRTPILKALKIFGFKMGTVKSKQTGTTRSIETKEKMSKAHIGMMRDEKHHFWKGEKASYVAIHTYVKRRKIKPQHCECCGKKTTILDLANISQKYLRDLTDWEYLCRRCHMIKDGRLKKLKMLPYKYNNTDKNNILKLKKQGYKLIEIANMYNTNYQNIQRILKTKYIL